MILGYLIGVTYTRMYAKERRIRWKKPKSIETQIDSYPNQIHHQALSVLYA